MQRTRACSGRRCALPPNRQRASAPNRSALRDRQVMRTFGHGLTDSGEAFVMALLLPAAWRWASMAIVHGRTHEIRLTYDRERVVGEGL